MTTHLSVVRSLPSEQSPRTNIDCISKPSLEADDLLTSKYGSLEFVGVPSSGMNGGEPAVVNTVAGVGNVKLNAY